MPPEDYQLRRTAIHEAGHVAAAEFLGEPWFSATVNPDGTGMMNPTHDSAPLKTPQSVIRGSFGRTPEMKALIQMRAIRFYAGRAAELVDADEAPHPERFFGYADFDDAEAILRSVEHESAADFCRLMAWEICQRQRRRIEELADALLRGGTIYAADWPPNK